MKIAFVTYEFPSSSQSGGIGTYVHCVSDLLAKRGHDVEVFCGSTESSKISVESGVRVQRVKSDSQRFPDAVLRPFLERHAEVKFDVLEGPDYGADTASIVRAAPEINHVVRLHSPSELIAGLWRQALTIPERGRILAHSLLSMTRPIWRPMSESVLEEQLVKKARAVIVPSTAMAEWVMGNWEIPKSRLRIIPCPYPPDDNLRSVPLPQVPRAVSFIGRLDRRKGVHTFASAIPEILQHCPEVRVRFVGRSGYCPGARMDMATYLRSRLKKFGRSIEICGPTPLARMFEVYAATDICVIPSLWESFGLVCFESMLAGRGIVATNIGAFF